MKKRLKGVVAYNLNPRTWRMGTEVVAGGGDKAWRWLVLGPIAINLGEA